MFNRSADQLISHTASSPCFHYQGYSWIARKTQLETRHNTLQQQMSAKLADPSIKTFLVLSDICQLPSSRPQQLAQNVCLVCSNLLHTHPALAGMHISCSCYLRKGKAHPWVEPWCPVMVCDLGSGAAVAGTSASDIGNGAV